MKDKNFKIREDFNGAEYIETKNLAARKRVVRLLVLFAFILLFSVIFSFGNITNNKILKNTYIQNIDVSGMTREEAKDKITKIYREKKNKNISLKHKSISEEKENFSTIVSYDQLDVNEDIEKAIEEAYSRGRTRGLFENNYAILLSNFKKKNFNANISINENSLDNVIKDTAAKLPDAVKKYSYYIEDEKLIIEKGNNGVKINENGLREKIKDIINNFNNEDENIEIPFDIVNAEEINIEKIAEEIKKNPKDAYVSQNPTEIHIEEKGVELGITIDEAKNILSEQKEEYSLPLKITMPSITVASLGEDAFANKLASFTTNYDASNVNRNNNLVLAAEKLNGTIVNPGEVFSYNKTIGQRTIAAGFKEAKAYANGDVVLDVGGGICQLSSTLYNAALYTNLDITERHSHYFETSYVDAGRDATVSWGSVDFKFKNNRKYPIKIEAKAGEGVVTVNIYGIKQEDDYTVLIESKVTSIIPRQEEHKTLGNPRNGEDGCTSETYKTLLKNGVVVSKTLISKDTYNALSKIIID